MAMTGADWTIAIGAFEEDAVSITPPAPSADDVEFTDLADTAKVFLPAIPDNGEIVAVFNYTKSLYADLIALYRVLSTVVVTASDGLTGTCTNSYIKTIEKSEATHGDPMTVTVTIKVSGAWTVVEN
jgi:hypothetical protein